MRELIKTLPIQCYWPDEIIEQFCGPEYRDSGFAAVVTPGKHVPGYQQICWAAADEASAISGLAKLVESLPGKLHTTVNGGLDFVQPMIDSLMVRHFALRDMHVEMVARPLLDQPVSGMVTPAELKDVPQIIELLTETFPGYGIANAPELAELLCSPTKAMFVVREGQAVAGVTDGSIYGKDSDHLFVHSVAVNPKHRGKGLGRALVQTLIHWGVISGAVKSMLWLSDVHNLAAKSLYLSLGYVDTGDREAELTRD